MAIDYNSKLFDYIENCTTPFQAVAHTAELLENAGCQRLCESEEWEIEPGKGYFVTRNGSSLIAFRVPKSDFNGFMMTAAHCDSPSFKIKENAELAGENHVSLSVEKYGGMLCSTWLDRPLSIAGRVLVNTEDGVKAVNVDLRENCALIPNVAIHMNRNANDGMSYNAASDMLPLYGSGAYKGDLRAKVAEKAGVDVEEIIATDLFLYNNARGYEWNGLISAPRLDDLQCAYACIEAFVNAEKGESANVVCIFDNEEVGSLTKQGADSTFLRDALGRICESLGKTNEDYKRAMANSFLVSCDNAHASHPNHPEYSDKNHTVYMNKGIVIKYNANQKYTSDAVSSAVFKRICAECDVPVQLYANRADMAGGSTLGNISNSQVSLNAIDIGLPQLAMHSTFETAGAKDTEYLVRALTAFYGKSLKMRKDGEYSL